MLFMINRLPSAFARAVVPVAGTPASRAASEIAFNLSRNLGTEICLTHVGRPAPAFRLGTLLTLAEIGEAQQVGTRLVDQASAMAEELGVDTQNFLRSGNAGEEILSLVREVDADLVVMGANLRRPKGRPFLGHTVETILRECSATVVLVLMPFDL